MSVDSFDHHSKVSGLIVIFNGIIELKIGFLTGCLVHGSKHSEPVRLDWLSASPWPPYDLYKYQIPLCTYKIGKN